MTVHKKQLVAQLKEAANLLDTLGEDPFRAKAFLSAARQIDAFEGDVAQLLAEDRLTEIRGVGQSLAAELATLKERERLPILDELYTRVPEGVRELFAVSGLGAKKIATLWQSGIYSLEDLLAATQDGRVAALKGFGKKSAEGIATAAQFALTARQRMRLDVAEAYAALLLEGVGAVLPRARAEFAGSLRRGLETVGDLDVVLTGVGFDEAQAALSPLLDVTEAAPPWLRGTLEGRPVDVLVVDDEARGAALMLLTGDQEYRDGLVARAAELGYELNEAGLFHDGARLPTPEELDVMAQLELPLIPPERRETANPPVVEGLLTPADVKGLVHNHSSWSDGAVSLREMVTAARALGYRYLAMADHSRSSYYANGLTSERVFAQAKEVAEIRAELAAEGSDFELLHGIEVDILPDGNLDYPDEVLAVLDYAVVSVHQNFNLSEREQTERIVRAVQNPYAGILGHATGRLLLRRPSYPVDLQAVIEACAATGTVIEINANPRRLDLDWRWVIRAKELGCKFSINPDAHHPEGFDDVRYGVTMARKAGLTPADVVNTAPTAAAFLAHLKKPGSS